MLTIIYQANSFWQFFIGNPQIRNAEDVAKDWFNLTLTIAFVGALAVFIFKALMKRFEPNVGRKVWSRKATWGLIAVGLLPIFIFLFAFWFVKPDYHIVMAFKGLVAGALSAAICYVLLLVVFHLPFWRRELV